MCEPRLSAGKPRSDIAVRSWGRRGGVSANTASMAAYAAYAMSWSRELSGCGGIQVSSSGVYDDVVRAVAS